MVHSKEEGKIWSRDSIPYYAALLTPVPLAEASHTEATRTDGSGGWLPNRCLDFDGAACDLAVQLEGKSILHYIL